MDNNSLLYIALERAINDYGVEVLISPYLANILSDYGAFEVHDTVRNTKKEIISTLVSEKYGERLIRWKKKRDIWEKENKKFIEDFKKKHTFNHIIVDELTKAFIDVLGLSSKNNPVKHKKKSIIKSIFGEKIILSKKDVEALVVGGVFELIILLITLLYFDGVSDGTYILPGYFCHIIFLIAMCLICETDQPSIKKHLGAGILYASLIGQLITLIIPIFIIESHEPPFLGLITVFLILDIIAFLIGSSKKPTQNRLFGYSLTIILTILLIVYTVPIFVKYEIIKEHKDVCMESIELRKTHMQQDVELGFMGVKLGDTYSDVVRKMKNSPNLIRKISLDKEKPWGYLSWYDIDRYQRNSFISDEGGRLEFDKELQYDVFFENDSIRLQILFIQDTVKYIHFLSDRIKKDLYSEKYGCPEYYYTMPPEKFVTNCRHYPYYNKISGEYDYRYLPSVQWTFASGTIEINSYGHISYISKDLLNMIEREKRERLEQENVQKERIHRQQQFDGKIRLKKVQHDMMETMKKEMEREKIEELHNHAISQI